MFPTRIPLKIVVSESAAARRRAIQMKY